MKFDWVVQYKCGNTIYEDEYTNEQHAREYAEEAKVEGYENVNYYKKSGSLDV